MRTLTQASNELQECRKERDDLDKRIDKLELEVAELTYSESFPVGKHLMLHKDRYLIVGYANTWGCPAIEVCKIKKDGSPSTRRQILRSYKLEYAILAE